MTTDLTDDDIFEAKLTKCVYLFARNLLHKVLNDLHDNHPNINKISIDSALLNNSSKTNNKDSSDTCKTEVTTSFDITSIFLGIQTIKNENVLLETESGKSLIEYVCEIKNIRNKLFHGITFDRSSLTGFKNSLIDFINKVCDCMVALFPKLTEYESFGETTQNNINELWKYNVNEDFGELKKYIKLRNEDAFGKTFRACRIELTKIYESIFTVPAFPNVKNLDFSAEEMFVPMLLTKDNKNICYQEMFLNDKAILLSGKTGKTTLSTKLILGWCQSINEIKSTKKTNTNAKKSETILKLANYDLVLFIEVKRAKESGLSQYLKEVLLPNSLLDKSKDDIQYFLKQLTAVLVIIDDFVAKSSEANDVITNLFDILSDQWFFITANPQHVDEVYAIVKQYFKISTVYIQSSGENEIELYVQKFFKILKRNKFECLDRDEFMSHFKKLEKDIQTIPYVNILLILWIKRKINTPVQTSTELYYQYLEFQKGNLINKLQQDLKEGSEALVAKSICELAKQCYENCEDSADVDTISNIQKQMAINGCYSSKYLKIFVSTFFLSIPWIRLHHTNEVNVYKFVHKTQMEFLVAHYIVSCLQLKDVDPILLQNENFGILKFVVGLLNNEKEPMVKLAYKTIFNLLKKDLGNDPDYHLLWTLLSETRTRIGTQTSLNPKFCALLRDLFSECGGSGLIWNLREENVVNALRIMCYADIPIKSIKINIEKSYNPYSIPLLKETLGEISQKNKNIVFLKNRVPIAVELHLKRHEYEQDGLNVLSSDDMLKYFQSWASITRFSGCLEKTGIETLQKNCCNNLSDIKVRIKSAEELNLLSNSFIHHKNLKVIYIIFDRPFKKGIKSIEPLCDTGKECKVRIHFNFVKGNIMKEAIQMVQKLKPRKNPFLSLSMKSNITLPEAKDLYPSLNGLILNFFEADAQDHDIKELNTCVQFYYDKMH